jgi:hypothetical protein
MYFEDHFHPTGKNDVNEPTNKELNNMKSLDRGYCKIYKMLQNLDGKTKKTSIEFYTSGHIGSNIRDAITGQYTSSIVGTSDEYQYYKVGLSTGESQSKNGSTTLFFMGPDEYARHFHVKLNDSIYEMWSKRKENITH